MANNSDTSKTIKCKLKKIMHHNFDDAKLQNCIKRANDIIFTCSHFIRAFMLYKFENNKQLPDLTLDFIMAAFKVLSKRSCGPNCFQQSHASHLAHFVRQYQYLY